MNEKSAHLHAVSVQGGNPLFYTRCSRRRFAFASMKQSVPAFNAILLSLLLLFPFLVS